MTDEVEVIYKKCFLCDEEFKFGHHHYDGKFVDSYKIMLCRICYDGSWDGYNSGDEEKIIDHVNQKGIKIPMRNEKGLLPRM